MKVKLLHDIRENVQINSLMQVTNPGTLKCSVRRGMGVAFAAGNVIEMSDASAQKYIDAKVAEPTDEPLTAPIPMKAKGPAMHDASGEAQTIAATEVGKLEAAGAAPAN
jgi:hypothetical protein